MFCSLLPVLGLNDFIKSGADSTVYNIYKQMFLKYSYVVNYYLKGATKKSTASKSIFLVKRFIFFFILLITPVTK